MAKPRIFVSSTYYDLKHVRSSMDGFIESLGFESILSEKGDIAYSPDVPLDESCYREAENADIFVMIIGGRYGSTSSDEGKKPTPTFFDKYESITKREYESALRRDVPSYILVENNVYAEYQTYLRNKGNDKIDYAHVDSVNVFRLVEEVLSRPRNNPLQVFDRFPDIEYWLREQWAGMFKELLNRQTNQRQMANLSSQVDALGAINDTLRIYLEAIVKKVSPDDGPRIIQTERQKLDELSLLDLLRKNDFFVAAHLDDNGVTVEMFKDALRTATSFENFAEYLGARSVNEGIEEHVKSYYSLAAACQDINQGREVLDLPDWELPDEVRIA